MNQEYPSSSLNNSNLESDFEELSATPEIEQLQFPPDPLIKHINLPHIPLTEEFVSSFLDIQSLIDLETLDPDIISLKIIEAYVMHYLLSTFNIKALDKGNFRIGKYRVEVVDNGSVTIYEKNSVIPHIELDGMYLDPDTQRLIILQVRTKVTSIALKNKIFNATYLDKIISFLKDTYPEIDPKKLVGLYFINPERNSFTLPIKHSSGTLVRNVIKIPYSMQELTEFSNMYTDKSQLDDLEDEVLDHNSFNFNVEKHEFPDNDLPEQMEFPQLPLNVAFLRNLIGNDRLLELKKKPLDIIQGDIAEILTSYILTHYFELEPTIKIPNRYFVGSDILTVTHTGSLLLNGANGEDIFEIDGLLFDKKKNKFIIVEAKSGNLRSSEINMSEKRVQSIVAFLKKINPSVKEENYVWLHVHSSKKEPTKKIIEINGVKHTNTIVRFPVSTERLSKLAEIIKYNSS